MQTRIGVCCLIVGIYLAICIVFADPIVPPVTKPDCIVTLVKQPAFVCELMRLENEYYLRCVLATRDTTLFHPVVVLAVNFPDTVDVFKWPLAGHRLQAKLSAMPDELFVFAVDSTQLIKILNRPDQMVLLIIGLPDKMKVVKIDYKTKQYIIMTLGLSEA